MTVNVMMRRQATHGRRQAAGGERRMSTGAQRQAVTMNGVRWTTHKKWTADKGDDGKESGGGGGGWAPVGPQTKTEDRNEEAREQKTFRIWMSEFPAVPRQAAMNLRPHTTHDSSHIVH